MKQTIFIPRHCRATLYKEIKSEGGGLQYVEAPRLLQDFHVGGLANVGSIFTRTFGYDSWRTSNIMSITKIRENINVKDYVHVYFQTRNTPYVLEVRKEVISFRDDLEPLVQETQRDINSDQWMKECKAFKEVVNDEFSKRREEEKATLKERFKESNAEEATKAKPTIRAVPPL